MINTNTTTLQFLSGKSIATMRVCTVIEPPPADYLSNVCSCPCMCGLCDDELCFHDATGTDKYYNDSTSFIYQRLFSTDDFDLTLYKKNYDGSADDSILLSGVTTIYDFGEVPNDETGDYKGFIINWYDVFTSYGNGEYYLKGTITKLGVVYEYESHTFKVRTFSCEMAKDTVKIEAYQNGYIESERMDLSGFNWYSSVRVFGKLSKGVPKFVTDRYDNSGRISNEIQTKIEDSFTLELQNMKGAIANQIVYNMALCNDIYVSDYNVNSERYSRKYLYVSEVSEMKTFSNNPQIRVTFLMKPRLNNIIKRNFKNKFTFDNGNSIITDENDSILWL